MILTPSIDRLPLVVVVKVVAARGVIASDGDSLPLYFDAAAVILSAEHNLTCCSLNSFNANSEKVNAASLTSLERSSSSEQTSGSIVRVSWSWSSIARHAVAVFKPATL